MKKLSAMLIAFTLMFSTVGTIMLFSNDHVVEAKSYKSGKKGFNFTNNNQSNSNSQNVNKATTNQSKNSTTTTSKKGSFTSGGLMRGLFVGGLAGLLFGSLFSDMGVLGSILGFLINVGAILLIAYLLFKIYYMVKRKNEEVTNHWKK